MLEWAKDYEMTVEEKRKQIISFAYGNLKLDGCDVTLEGVEKAYDEIFGIHD